jgi:predicted GIY-YIG superfamily endonuclease
MHYVYILQSESHTDQFYTGLCSDVPTRLAAHNAGQSPHTSKYKPWRILSYHAFDSREAAARFERYLKTGSGRAFALKHFRS